MEVSGIFTIAFTILILLLALGLFVYMIVTNKIQFSHTLTQKDAEKDLAVKQTFFDTQEAERKRIGEDLHDDMGPRLAIIRVQLSNIKRKFPETSFMLDPILDEFKDMVGHVRQVSHNLVPNILYEMGLAEAVRYNSQVISQMKGLISTCHISDDLPPMDKKIELAIYRIIQESINNAIKHADASQIDITVVHQNGNVIAEISDDGKGFDNSTQSDGLGLSNIRERTETLNGVVTIQSSADSGTKLSVKIPT